ncbi:MAG: T9SS type A sorting domain-containing protein [Chloroflexota bacterium]
MKKIGLIISLFAFALISNALTYSSPYANPLGGQWLTLDSMPWYGAPDIGITRFVKVKCYDSLHCVALANEGLYGRYWCSIRQTTDGGTTWRDSYIYNRNSGGEQPIMRFIYYPTKDIIVVGCDSGYVRRSVDGGATWDFRKVVEVEKKPQYSELRDMYMKGPIAIMDYVGFENNYISTDWGETWEKLDCITDPILTIGPNRFSIVDTNLIIMSAHTEIRINDDSTEYVACFFKSPDKGKSWSLIKQYRKEDFIYPYFDFYNENIGYSTYYTVRHKENMNEHDTSYTTIYKTYTQGKSWHKLYSITQPGLGYSNICIFDSLHIMVSSFTGLILSSDGGYSWENIDNPKFADINDGWLIYDAAYMTAKNPIITNGAKLIKYVGKEVSIPELRLEGEAISIYPNPARDFISLSALSIAHGDRIEIYSQLGVKILEVTTGEENIDVSRLPAGVYFIRIGARAGKFVKINY